MTLIGTSADEVRALFNSRILPRIRTGELTSQIVFESLAAPQSRQAPATLSQLLEYYSEGRLVAVAHQFLRPDGTLGGSGRPDPKGIEFDGDWLYVNE